MNAEFNDDDLARFESQGGTRCRRPMSKDGWNTTARASGTRRSAMARRSCCARRLGHSGNWGNQVPALLAAGYRAIVIDSRGHGRSTRDDEPYSYERMASDVLAVLDALHVDRARFVGWSDGACIALVLADRAPERAAGVFFFACNMDPSGTKEIVPSAARPLLRAHRKDYAALSATPDQFDAFVAAVSEMMRTQPDYRAQDLAAIAVPVTIVLGEHDEFIRPEHAAYLASTIPGATLTTLPGVSHLRRCSGPSGSTRRCWRFSGGCRVMVARAPARVIHRCADFIRSTKAVLPGPCSRTGRKTARRGRNSPGCEQERGLK